MDQPVTWRNRTNNQQQETQAYRTLWSEDHPEGVTVSTPTGVSGVLGFMSDNNHPNYKRVVGEGGVIMGDCILQKNTQTFSSASVVWQVPGLQCELKGDFASQVMNMVTIPEVHTENILSGLMDLELIKAYALITQDSVMSGEILSDLGKTVNMLRAPFSGARLQLERMFKRASRHYRADAKSISQANASAWLEGRYGMVPFYLDINRIIEIFNGKYRDLAKHRAVVRSGSTYTDHKVITYPHTALPVLYSIGYQLYSGGWVDCNRSVAVNSGVMYEVRPRTLGEELSVQFQLGASAIIPTAWNLIPFSFVADWFFSIGDWLAANNLPPDVNVVGNWTTTTKRYTDTLFGYLGMVMNNLWRHGDVGMKSKVTFVLDRRTNRPLPTLPVTTQRWATVTHALDAAALLHSPIKDLCTLLRR